MKVDTPAAHAEDHSVHISSIATHVFPFSFSEGRMQRKHTTDGPTAIKANIYFPVLDFTDCFRDPICICYRPLFWGHGDIRLRAQANNYVYFVGFKVIRVFFFFRHQLTHCRTMRSYIMSMTH